MANQIKVKRGLQANLPTLALGEFGLTTDKEQLFIGGTVGNIALTEHSIVSYNNTSNLFTNNSTTLYVAPDSSVTSGNDGLSPSTPIKLNDVKNILETLSLKFGVLRGEWTIQLNDGVYQSNGVDILFRLSDIKTTQRLTVKGTNVGDGVQPLAIIDGLTNGGQQYVHGFFFINTHVTVENILFRNFLEGSTVSAGTTRIGLASSGKEGSLTTKNVWCSNCDWAGIFASSHQRLYVESGHITNCRVGVYCISSIVFTIGFNGEGKPDNQKVNISGCLDAGITLQSLCDGHVDDCIIENNTARGVDVTNNSHAHLVRNRLTSNEIGIRAKINSSFLDSNNTFSGNNINFTLLDNGVHKDNTSNDGLDKRNVSNLYDILGKYYVNSFTGDSVLFEETIPKYALQGRGKTYEMILTGRFANLGGNSSEIRVYSDDGTNKTLIDTIPLGSTTDWSHFKYELMFSNYTDTNNNTSSNFQNVDFPYIFNQAGVLCDTTKDVTFSAEIVGVVGTASATLYRSYSRVVY